MNREEAEGLMMAAIDGELDAAGRNTLDAYLLEDADARAEFEAMRELAERTGRLRLAEPPPEVWDRYMDQLRPQLERTVGFGLLYVGIGGLVLAFALLFLRTPAIPPGVKLLGGAAVAGLAMLLLSVWREKRHVGRRERYGRVRR